MQVLGLTSVPGAGDTFLVVEEDRMARQIAERRAARERNARHGPLAASGSRSRTWSASSRPARSSRSTSSSRATCSGSVEALEDALLKIDVGEEVDLRIIHRGVGAITETDINLAMASDAIIIGFNVRPDGRAKTKADREGVEIRYYSVIYQAIEEIEAALKGMLKPEFEEVQLGTAEIREVFRSSKIGNIAGVHGPLRSDPPQRQGAADPRRVRGGRQPDHRVAAASSRTTPPRSARASSAVSASGRTTTSRSTTSIETFEMREKPRV